MGHSPVHIVGRGEFHRQVLAELTRAAATDVEVILLGPTGVGKELYARWIHAHSPRGARPFVPVNCGAIPITLFENELFGHVGGAYTSASASSDGLVAEAEGGTLFLDEIDALEPANQVKLLRFLQEREYRRLGESRIRKANVRIVGASNADLVQLARTARFREDLLFRVHVFPVRVPPLCERSEDIEPLLNHFAATCACALKMAPVRFTPEVVRHLEAYSWPGNVRELENCVRYLTVLGLDREVEPGDLNLVGEVSRRSAPPPAPDPSIETNGARSLRDAKRAVVGSFERNFIITALRTSGGNIAHAAQASGKTRRAFFELMRKYKIAAGDYRQSALRQA